MLDIWHHESQSHSVTTINDDLHRCCTQSSGGWRLAWGTSLEVAFLNRIWCYGIEHNKYYWNRLHVARYVGIVVIVFQNRWIQRSLGDMECRSAWGDQVIPSYGGGLVLDQVFCYFYISNYYDTEHFAINVSQVPFARDGIMVHQVIPQCPSSSLHHVWRKYEKYQKNEQASKPNFMPKHGIIDNFFFGAPSSPTMLFFLFPSSRSRNAKIKWKTTKCKTKFRGIFTCLSFAHDQFLTQHTAEN